MKYAIQANYYMWNEKEEKEEMKWLYLGIKGAMKIFVFDDEVNERTKLFNTAKEAGEYVDKHFSPEEMRCSFNSVRIVEVEA